MVLSLTGRAHQPDVLIKRHNISTQHLCQSTAGHVPVELHLPETIFGVHKSKPVDGAFEGRRFNQLDAVVRLMNVNCFVRWLHHVVLVTLHDLAIT